MPQVDSGILRLYRNSTIHNTHQEALTALHELADLADGQPVLSRYYTNEATGEVRALLGITSVVKKDATDVKTLTIFDVEGTDAAIKALQDKINADKYVKTIEDSHPIDNATAQDVDVYTVTHGGESDTTSTFKTIYHPISPAGSVVPKSVGDIVQGTTVEQLSGRPISQILDDILFETIYPTVLNPTVKSFDFKDYSTVAKGSNTAKANIVGPAANNFKSEFNRGTATIVGATTTTVPYAGNATTTTYTVSYQPHATTDTAMIATDGTAYTNRTTFDTNLGLGKYTYKVTIDYNEGVEIKDSKGKTCPANKFVNPGSNGTTNPKTAGSVTSEFTVTTSLPAFITTVTTGINGLVEQGMKPWGAMTFGNSANGSDKWPGTSPATPFIMDLPRKLNTFKSYNSVSGKYDVDKKSYLTESTVDREINGKNYKYFRYTWTGAASDAVAYQVITK